MSKTFNIIIIFCLNLSQSLSFRHVNEESRFPNGDDSSNYFDVLDSSHVHAVPDARVQDIRTDNIRSRTLPNAMSMSGTRDRSPIMFPDMSPGNFSLDSTPIKRDKNSRTNRIPLKILRKINHEQDISKVFEKYVSNVKLQEVKGQVYLVDLEGQPIDAGFGGPVIIETPNAKPLSKVKAPVTGFSLTFRNISRPSSLNAERLGTSPPINRPAVCEPELKTVELPTSNDPNIIQFPKCVRLERCGGCCGSDLLTCEPLRTRTTEIQVQRFGYNEESEKLEYRETETIVLPSHTECRCNCRLKAADCSPNHAYSSEDCLCTCKNSKEQKNCLPQPHKLWDSNRCQCVCRELKACSSGYSFNLETCECTLTTDYNINSPFAFNRNSRRRRRDPQKGRRRYISSS